MIDTFDTTVYVVWDETGCVASHVDAAEAADLLTQTSDGRFRRLLALRLRLPPAVPIEMSLAVLDNHGTAIAEPL